MSNPQPSQEQIRQARHLGFVNSLAQHKSESDLKKLYNSYSKQDARRERNVGNFVATVRGQR